MSSSTPSPSQTETTDASLPVVHVDPGQVIRINARFPGNPEKVFFSFLPPRTKKAVHDPGADHELTLIRREHGDLYYYTINTKQMPGGVGWWHFYSEDPDPAKCRAKVGTFVVRDVPAALLERPEPIEDEEPSGLDLLGLAEDGEDDYTTPILIGLGVAAVVGVVAIATTAKD